VLRVLLTIGFAAAAGSCGVPGFRTCEVDSDCRSGEICAEPEGTTGGRCAKRCDSDEDCERPGTTCQPYVDPDRDRDEEICLSADVGSDSETGTRCSSNKDCKGFDAGPAVCGINGRCILVEQRRAVRIVDRRPNGELGGDGAEIAAVYLEDEAGQIVSFGDTISWCPSGATDDGGDTDDTGYGDAGPVDATDTTDGATADGAMGDTGVADTGRDARDASAGRCRPASESPIDGTKPRLSEDKQCIEGSESETARLGIGGDLLVEFVGADGRRVDIEDAHAITVIEWGDNCDVADAEVDDYNIELCTTNGESFDRGRDCRPLATGREGKSTVRPDLPDETSN